MNWIHYPKTPPEYRLVLVQVAATLDGQSSAIAVGYVKRMSDGMDHWIIPRVGVAGGVVAWADVLGDDFSAEVWPGTQRRGSLDNATHPARAVESAPGARLEEHAVCRICRGAGTVRDIGSPEYTETCRACGGSGR